MRGIFLADRNLELKTDLPIPNPTADESLVRVIRAGICNTDLELLSGYYPYNGILGHEFVGIVESGPDHLVNKRVVGEINAVCGNCYYCNNNQSSHCENRTVLGIVNHNGAFADYLCLPSKNLYVVPDHLETDVATFTEPLAAALEIQQQISIKSSDRVLVVGDGKLGQLVAQSLHLTGCDLLVIGRNDVKLQLLKSKGISVGLKNDVVSRSYDISVECTGNPEGFEIARCALRPRGTLVLKSTYSGKLTIDVSSIVVDEISLIGSRCGPFPAALALLASNQIDVSQLISSRFPLSEGVQAFEYASRKGVLKVLLDMTSSS